MSPVLSSPFYDGQSTESRAYMRPWKAPNQYHHPNDSRLLSALPSGGHPTLTLAVNISPHQGPPLTLGQSQLLQSSVLE